MEDLLGNTWFYGGGGGGWRGDQPSPTEYEEVTIEN